MIEKSAAREAYFPSLPTIPIPTFASKIIPTSFPPSPTHATHLPVYFQTAHVISAFYVGEHQQTQTTGALQATSKKYFSSF